jgi:predicted phosphodiesterase
MRWGIFGDCHGNLQGLQAAVERLKREGVDRFLCLGDVVGYGAEPNECCALIRSIDAVCLLGNHDQAALGDADLTWFNDAARQAAEWTRHQLEPDHSAWLAGLQPLVRLAEPGDEPFLAVHGALPDPWQWGYVADADDAAGVLAACEERIVVVGHSHLAEVYRAGGGGRVLHHRFSRDGEIRIDAGFRYVLNPGSCGQPRDREWKIACGLLDLNAGLFQVWRLSYDFQTAADRILWAGLPAWLAARLYEGR